MSGTKKGSPKDYNFSFERDTLKTDPLNDKLVFNLILDPKGNLKS